MMFTLEVTFTTEIKHTLFSSRHQKKENKNKPNQTTNKNPMPLSHFKAQLTNNSLAVSHYLTSAFLSHALL